MDKSLKYNKALEYEIFVKEEYGFAKEKIKKANCIFDIWWHVWYFSEWCRKYNKTAKIYYYEPISELYDLAFEKLHHDKNVILNNFWVSEKTEEWILLFDGIKTMQSSKFSSFLNQKWEAKKVKFLSFNDIVDGYWFPLIDLVKIDIEWMEFDVLSSLSFENRKKIGSLIIEVHLLNDEFNERWNNLYSNLKEKFSHVELIPSWYTEKIFLVWAFSV